MIRKKVVCKGTIDEKVDMEVTEEIIANDDEIVKMEENLKADFTKMGISATAMEKNMEQMKKSYDGLDGVIFTYDIDKKTYSYVIEIDLKKADLDTLIDRKLINAGNNTEDYLSLKQMSSDFEKIGIDILQNATTTVIEKDGEKYASLKAIIESFEKEEMICN